ncbi:MAG: DMP19 family protein [Dysgonamonadaceae bacterium]|nr:DMP19 family protein [Dysgonamonadaceae bacterium]MDD4730095.1 DMP19 family protein [Dysgonamonadaceae bacterium]
MIQITEKQIAASIESNYIDYINLYTDAYLIEVENNLNAENIKKLDGYQHALLAYRIFREEVTHGGFVQLIQNGYGGYIFDNPTAKALKIFGAEKTAKIIYKAKKIFDANRKELERETTDEEFNAMYVDFEVFGELEEKYFSIEKEETSTIARFVNENRSLFAEVV